MATIWRTWCGTGLLIALMAESAAAQLSITPLETPTGAAGALVSLLSDDGHVAYGTVNGSTPVRWTLDPLLPPETLPRPAGWLSAYPVSTTTNGGLMLLNRNSGSGNQAAIWDGATMRELPNPSGATATFARNITPDGNRVVGSASFPAGSRAVEWDAAGAPTLLTLPANTTSSGALMRDTAGRVIGGSGTSGAQYHQYLTRWTGSSVEQLCELPSGLNISSGPVAATSDGSLILGTTDVFQFQRTDAWAWSQGTGPVTIAPLPGMRYINIYALSDTGVAVGVMYGAAHQTSISFAWTASTGALPLSQYLTTAGLDLSPWSGVSAFDISADGRRILGQATDAGGQSTSVLITLPAPAACSMVAAGLALAALRRRR